MEDYSNTTGLEGVVTSTVAIRATNSNTYWRAFLGLGRSIQVDLLYRQGVL